MECVVSHYGQTCIESIDMRSLIVMYVCSRGLEQVVRDVANKWNDLMLVDSYMCLE